MLWFYHRRIISVGMRYQLFNKQAWSFPIIVVVFIVDNQQSASVCTAWRFHSLFISVMLEHRLCYLGCTSVTVVQAAAM